MILIVNVTHVVYLSLPSSYICKILLLGEELPFRVLTSNIECQACTSPWVVECLELSARHINYWCVHSQLSLKRSQLVKMPSYCCGLCDICAVVFRAVSRQFRHLFTSHQEKLSGKTPQSNLH